MRIASSWFLSPGVCRRGVEATGVIDKVGCFMHPTIFFVPENCMISDSLIYLESGEPSHCNDVGRDSNASSPTFKVFILRTLIEYLILRIDSSSVVCTADELGVLLIKCPWLQVGKCAMRRGFLLRKPDKHLRSSF